MTRKRIILIFVLLSSYLCGVSLYGEVQEESNPINNIYTQNAEKTGIIFNVNDILLDLDSYQGGIGFKRYFTDSLAYRAAFDFSYSDSSSSLLVSLGNTLEYHFIRGRISPYIGAFIDVVYASYRDEIDSDNWSQVMSIPVSIGPLFGVEVAIFEFLSLFVEYSIIFDYTTTITNQSVGGSESKATESIFSVDTGIGNDSKIGIVIYFNRIFEPGKKI